jgi:Membrane-bound lytic murein transglycosylase B
LVKGLKPDRKWLDLQAFSVSAKAKIEATEAVKLLSYEQEKGRDLWVGMHNFYVITRYNHSPLYAMAVYQLSEAVYHKKQGLMINNTAGTE